MSISYVLLHGFPPIVSYNRPIHLKCIVLVCSTNYMKSDKKWFHQNYKPTQYNLHTESMQKLSLVLTYMLFEFQSRVEIQKSTWRNIKGPRWPNGQRLQYFIMQRVVFAVLSVLDAGSLFLSILFKILLKEYFLQHPCPNIFFINLITCIIFV